MCTSASSRRRRRRPVRARFFERGDRRERHRQDARHRRARHRARGRRPHVRRPCTMAQPAARRYPHPAWQLVVLLPDRHVHRAVGAAHPAVLALRPPVRASLTALLVVAAALASMVPIASAQETIRVVVLDGARVAELRGTDIEIAEMGPGATTWRAETVRAIPVVGGIDIDGRRAPAFRLRSERPMRLNGREYPGALEIIRSGDGLAVVNEPTF